MTDQPLTAAEIAALRAAARDEDTGYVAVALAAHRATLQQPAVQPEAER